MKTFEMVFACKKCRKVFRKDSREFEEADEFCPHCDNHFMVPAKTPKMAIGVESEQGYVMASRSLCLCLTVLFK